MKSDILALCPDEFPVTRYHSLVVDEASLPDELKVTARTAAGVIMGLSHVEAELHGVQFHPNQLLRLRDIGFWPAFYKSAVMVLHPARHWMF